DVHWCGRRSGSGLCWGATRRGIAGRTLVATVISDWFRGSRPETPTPIWRNPPRGLACRLIGRPVSAAAAQTGSHIWCNTGSGAPTQSKMTLVGRPNSATLSSSATASSGVWHGSGRSMLNLPFDSSYQFPCPVVDGANAGSPQFRILSWRDLFIGTVAELGIDPVPVHVFAAILGVCRAEDAGLRL